MRKKVINLLFYIAVASVFVEFSIGGGPINVNIPNLLIIATLLITSYSVIGKSRLKIKFLILLLISVVFISFNVSSFDIRVGESTNHIRKSITLSKGVIVMLAIYYWVSEYVDLKKISTGLVWAGIIAFLGALAQIYFAYEGAIFPDQIHPSRIPALGSKLGASRASGFLEGYGLLGIYMESAALISAIGFLSHGRRQGWSRGLALIGVVIALTGLLVTESRSGLVATVVGYGVFYILATLVYSRFTLVRMTPVAVIVGAVLFTGPELWEAIVSVNRKGVTGRLEGYLAAIKSAAKNPIFGIGFSNMYAKLDYYMQIHNSYLNILSGGGVVAFLSYVYFNGRAITEALNCLNATDQRAPLAIGLLSALSAAMVECMLWGGGIYSTAMFIIIGLLISLGRVPTRVNKNPYL